MELAAYRLASLRLELMPELLETLIWTGLTLDHPAGLE
jgi:hypothetical protein